MVEKVAMPSVLSFDRKISCSDAVLNQGKFSSIEQFNDWLPVEVHEKSIRGVMSNRLKANEESKMSNANLQTIDYAALNHENDTLCVDFTVKVLGNIQKPCACNSFEFNDALNTKICKIDYSELLELGKLYAYSILSARFLWRNRLGAENIVTKVIIKGKDPISVNSLDYSLDKIIFDNKTEVETLGKLIADVFANKSEFLTFSVKCFAQIGFGQDVFPSQELVQTESKSKVLYFVSDELSPKHAAMHSQKVGNAVRSIDIWHPEYDEFGPIAVETYGSVTNLGRAFRSKKGFDFYSLFDKWFKNDVELARNERMYVLACLIRGGVFGDSKQS